MFQNQSIYITSDKKMADAILGNPYLMLLLEHFGVDVPLQEKNVQEVCVENQINTELFLTFANLYSGYTYKPEQPFSVNDVKTIVNYLKNSHKYYIEEIYPKILHYIRNMKLVNDHAEMVLVEKFFTEYITEVIEHLDYENNVVHPYILRLSMIIKKEDNITPDSVYSVSEYKEHHNDIEEKLDDLRNLLVKYLPIKNDSALRRKLLFKLYELEYDLNIHSQIEDLVLIPLVSQMENQIKLAK